MVSRILFWAGFGVATRAWQLGLQNTSPLAPKMLWAYPIFAGCGASFGYWLQNVDEKQVAILEERKQAILEKRARRAARESEGAGVPATA
ncbi:hypothetical protein N0V82_008416 [Gnomoniopsis sp. IMI 355080]|nr:hypothetical protein N0V82_008416 [Gnomoniopsis sp. IMI 355080]